MSGYYTPDQISRTKKTMFDQDFIDAVQKLRQKLNNDPNNPVSTGPIEGGYGNEEARQMFQGAETIAPDFKEVMSPSLSTGAQFPANKGITVEQEKKIVTVDPMPGPKVPAVSPTPASSQPAVQAAKGSPMKQAVIAAAQRPVGVPGATSAAGASISSPAPAQDQMSSYQTPNPATPQPSAPVTGYNGPNEAKMQAIRDEYAKNAPPINLGVMDTIGNIGAMLRNGYDTYNSWQNGVENPTPQEQATAAEMLRNGADPRMVNQYIIAMRSKRR